MWSLNQLAIRLTPAHSPGQKVIHNLTQYFFILDDRAAVLSFDTAFDNSLSQVAWDLD